MVRSIGNYDEVGCSGYYSFLSALTRGTDENKVATISTDDTVALVTEDENFSGVVRVISQGDKLAGVQTDGWAEVEYTAGDELMPNQADRDFSGASAWENVDIDSYNETNDLSITANAANQYCKIAETSVPTVAGRRYRLYFDVANLTSTWTIKSYDGTQTIGTVSQNGTNQYLEFVAETSGGLRIVAGSDTSSADFDNFSLKEVGVGSSEEDEELIGGTIIGVYSVTNQDQLIDNVELDENGAVNIRLAAGATAANYFKVEVLKSEDQWPKAYLVRSVDDTNYKCTLFLDN